jgi:hypothetical protein
MGSFQKIVLITAIIILLIVLVIVGIALAKSQQNAAWPPMTPDCPDWWAIQGDVSGNNTVCVNVKNLGTCPPKNGQAHLTMNFNSAAFTGSNGTCNKYNWANGCNVSWDGITYGVSNPCSS